MGWRVDFVRIRMFLLGVSKRQHNTTQVSYAIRKGVKRSEVYNVMVVSRFHPLRNMYEAAVCDFFDRARRELRHIPVAKSLLVNPRWSFVSSINMLLPNKYDSYLDLYASSVKGYESRVPFIPSMRQRLAAYSSTSLDWRGSGWLPRPTTPTRTNHRTLAIEEYI